MLRCSTIFAALLVLQFASSTQAAPVQDAELALATLKDFKLIQGMQWNSRKLLELQQLLSEKRILYLQIAREQQLQRKLIIAALLIDLLMLICLSVNFLLGQPAVNNKLDI